MAAANHRRTSLGVSAWRMYMCQHTCIHNHLQVLCVFSFSRSDPYERSGVDRRLSAYVWFRAWRTRRPLYDSILHSWPVYASELETGVEPLLVFIRVPSRLRPL